MAVISNSYTAPATKNEKLRRSIYETIIQIGADETPILSKIGSSSVTNPLLHSWLTDTLAKPKQNKNLEITGLEENATNTVQKTSNATQIFKTEVMVSDSLLKARQYGGNEMEYQMGKKAKEHKLDIEYALFGLGRDEDVKTSVFKEHIQANENTAGEMAGMFYYLAKNETSFTNGRRGNVLAFDSNGDWSGNATELTEYKLNEILQSIWDKGVVAKDVFVGAKLKQSKLFKNALNNYIKVDKEQNTKLQDALQKEGIIKGDGFIMNKPNPKAAKSDLKIQLGLNDDIKKNLNIDTNTLKANLEVLKNKHPEIFKTKGGVARIIKAINDNPNRYYKNDRLDISLIAKDLSDGKLGKMGIVNQGENAGKIAHVSVSSDLNKESNRLKNRNKKHLGVGSPTPTLRLTDKQNGVANGANALSLDISNLIKDKPKESLSDKISKLNQKNQEKKAKTQKAIDEIHEKVKPKDKDILKRFDDYLGENKKLNLEYLKNLDLNPANYNLTREFIINAKNNIDKDIKTDIPDTMRKNIEQKLNIKPLKEFGINYAEYYHDGTRAIKKLMQEKQGQVAGAFHRKDLGDIDLVWGDGNFGLSHIINRREEDFIKQGINKIEAKNKALNFVKEIENIISNGEVKKGNNRAFIDAKNSRVVVALDYKGKDKKWIVTAYNFY